MLGDPASPEPGLTPARFVLIFGAGGPSLREMLAVRRFDERLRDAPMNLVHERLAGRQEYDFGVWPIYRRVDLAEKAAQHGLRLAVRKFLGAL